MNQNEINAILNTLSKILMKPFVFENFKIELSYAARAKHSPRWVINTHHHPWFEFNYVSKGSVYTTIADTEFLVTAGESYIIPPGVSHSHRNNGTGDDGICIRFRLVNLDRANSHFLTSIMKPQPFAFNSNIDRLGLNISEIGIKSEFCMWLFHIYEKHYDLLDTRETIYQNSNDISVQVISYIEEYYKRKIKLSDIANVVNTTTRTLTRKFKAETGITIFEKITEIRLAKAKSLLSSTNAQIFDIAIASGYENEFYFSKIFKQYEKISPSNYRKRHSRG